MRQPRVRGIALVLAPVALLAGALLRCDRGTPGGAATVQNDAAPRASSAPRVEAPADGPAVTPAATATSTAQPSATAPSTPPAQSAPPPVAPSVAASGSTGFLGGSDAATLRRVCDAPIARIERNRGGSTISFRVWFEDGSRGLFKPQQTNSVANFRAELAAYRLSRLLDLHRVPPACGRTMPRTQLQRIADGSGDPVFSERVMRELLSRGDTVPGAMLHWVPGPLEAVPDVQRWPELLDATHTLTAEETELAADMARLILFDFVTDNVDRWSGGNILRQHPPRQPPTPMLFMDNGAAFTVGENNLGARPTEQAARLARVQRLPRAMLTALRALTAERLSAAMRDDPLGSPLGPAQITALLARRDRVLAHADALVTAHGETQAYALP